VPRTPCFVFACLLFARSALAADELPQPESDQNQPQPSAAPPAPEVEDPRLVRARAFTSRAESLFAQGAYDISLTEFLRAHAALAGHPRQYVTLHDIAVCYERLHRYDRALEYYEAYLSRAPATEADRAEVAAVVRALRSLLAVVTVKSNVSAEIWVDDRRVGSAPGRVVVPAGQHTLELRAAQHETERRELQLSAGETTGVSVMLRKLSTYSGPPRGYFWASLVATGASVVAGSVFGALALSAHADAEDDASLHLQPGDAADRAQSMSVAADVCFGAAGVLGAASTVLYFVTDWSSQESDQPAAARGEARRSRGDFGMALRGSF
jgi:tetratricopeptide (TPR) repeat protein